MAKRPNDSTVKDVEEIVKKKGKMASGKATINKKYLERTGDIFKNMQEDWKSNTVKKRSGFVLGQGFPVGSLPDFLTESEYDVRETFTEDVHGNRVNGCSLAEDLKKDLENLEFHEKKNDLYQFQQSDDLKNFDVSSIKEFRQLLEVQMLPWLQELTGIPLTETIDVTCSKYEYTDRLLCHDDEFEGRRIAFIFYLVPPWSTGDGGLLEFFNTDSDGQPDKAVWSVVPAWNAFVFFEVNPVSFHQVSEVLSSTKTRLSINGWFHGPSVPRPPHFIEPSPDFSQPLELPIEVLDEWINPMYLDIAVQLQIQQQFEEDSQIELPDFLVMSKYEEVSKDFNSFNKWHALGPPNRRCVDCLTLADPPGESPLKVFISEPFCLLLSHLTGLQLSHRLLEPDPEHENESCNSSSNIQSSGESGCHGNIYQWRPGCYTLLSDTSSCQDEFLLEATMFFNADKWTIEMGGEAHYILKDEDEELLCVAPQSNSLALVYKDKHTMNYVEYVNNRGCGLSYHTISALYKEKDNICEEVEGEESDNESSD